MKNKTSKTTKLRPLAKHNVVRSRDIKVFLGNDEIKDNDMKALMLIAVAMRLSTPRMRVANLNFVLNSPKYKLQVV